MSWRYFASSITGNGTETIVDLDLPFEDVTINDVISGDQALNAKIAPEYQRLKAADGSPLFKEWGTAIYAETDGAIRFGGILTDSGFSGPEWTLECVGYTGWWRDTPWTLGGRKYIRADPFDIVEDIFTLTQNIEGCDLGLELNIPKKKTGGKVSIGTELKQVQFDTQSGPVSFESGPYKLNWYSNLDLGSDIDDLASSTPFDYHERHAWSGDQIRHILDFGYPQIGGKIRNDLRFVYGENIFEPPSVSRSGDDYADLVYVLGAGEGAAMVRGSAAGPRNGRVRRIKAISDDTKKSQRSANSRASAEVKWRSKLDDISEVIVMDHPHAPLGSAQVGDIILLEGRLDWLDVSMQVKITGISYQPANGKVASYSVARTDKIES